MDRRTGRVAVLGACLLLAAGCRDIAQKKDPARDRTEQAVSLLVRTREGVVASEQKVDVAQAALRTLRDAQGDLRPAFNEFGRQIEAVRAEAKRLQSEADVVRSQGFLYTSARNSDVSQIQNEQMRAAAIERTERVRERYDRINALYGETGEAFAEYLRTCDDLRTYLSNDLNFPALESSKRWIAESLKAGEVLRERLRTLAEELSLTSNVLSPVPVPMPTTTPATQE